MNRRGREDIRPWSRPGGSARGEQQGDLAASLKDLVAGILDEAKHQGASAAEVSAGDSTGLVVSVRKGELETVEFTNDRGFGITVYVGDQEGLGQHLRRRTRGGSRNRARRDQHRQVHRGGSLQRSCRRRTDGACAAGSRSGPSLGGRRSPSHRTWARGRGRSARPRCPDRQLRGRQRGHPSRLPRLRQLPRLPRGFVGYAPHHGLQRDRTRRRGNAARPLVHRQPRREGARKPRGRGSRSRAAERWPDSAGDRWRRVRTRCCSRRRKPAA